MKLLDLFSGIGGFSYGLEKIGFKTIAFCEMDKYCKLVLQKHWRGVKIYNDVKEITKERLEADHIEPWEKGGRTDVSNGQTLCKPCNGSKSNSYEIETLDGKDDDELGDLFRNGKITLEQMKSALSKDAA